jgi:hypothetical protein
MVWHSYCRAQIKEKQFQKKYFQTQDSTSYSTEKPCKATCLRCKGHLSSSTTLEERPSGDRSSLTSELESEMCLEDLPMRQRLVKSPAFFLTFSSSSELEELSLEKSKSLRAAHTQDMIFWNFFFFLSPKRCFFLSSPLL